MTGKILVYKLPGPAIITSEFLIALIASSEAFTCLGSKKTLSILEFCPMTSLDMFDSPYTILPFSSFANKLILS